MARGLDPDPALGSLQIHKHHLARPERKWVRGKRRRLGLAISTRNRPEMLELCLKHFKAFPPSYEYRLLVLDDNSSDAHRVTNERLCRESGLDLTYILTPERLGVARVKNESMQLLAGSDYYMLFDDDAMPSAHGWDKLYIETSDAADCHHLLYNASAGPYVPIGRSHGIHEFNGPLGVVLFMTQAAIETVGAIDEEFGIYGHEHIRYTERMEEGKMLSNITRSPVPIGAEDYIYAFDLQFVFLNRQPPMGALAGNFRNSFHSEPKDIHLRHADRVYAALKNSPIYVPFNPRILSASCLWSNA